MEKANKDALILKKAIEAQKRVMRKVGIDQKIDPTWEMTVKEFEKRNPGFTLQLGDINPNILEVDVSVIEKKA